MESKDLQEHSAERSAVLERRLDQGVEPLQMCTGVEDEPEVVELAGQVKEALAPVKAPSSVRDKLRVELLEVAQHRQCQDMIVEPPPRRREWAVGAVVALVGGALYLLRSRISGREPRAESK